MEMQEMVITWESIKLAVLVLLWILWVTLWGKSWPIPRIWEIWSMEGLCILRVVVPCKNRWPLEKISILHCNGFRTKMNTSFASICVMPKSMWDEDGDRQLFGPNVIKESEENVKLIWDRLKVAQSRQNSYAYSKTQGGSLWNRRQSISTSITSSRS